MLTLLIIMEFNVYGKIKLLLSYMNYGYIDKNATAIRKHWIQNNYQDVSGIC